MVSEVQIAEYCNRWDGYEHLDPAPAPSVLFPFAARLPPPLRRRPTHGRHRLTAVNVEYRDMAEETQILTALTN
jgi:hypothetical protein